MFDGFNLLLSIAARAPLPDTARHGGRNLLLLYSTTIGSKLNWDMAFSPCNRRLSTLIVRCTEGNVMCLTLVSRLLDVSPTSDFPAVPSPFLCPICVAYRRRRRRRGLPDMAGHATPRTKDESFRDLIGFGFHR